MTNNSHLKKIPPIFISVCNQNPVTINIRKLIDSHHASIQITTTQIASLLALIEAETRSFDSINLDDHHLQVRVQELRDCLSIILEEKICQYLRCSPDDQSIPQSFWIKKWNLNQDDNKTGTPEYLLSWSITRKLLLQTRESVYINAKYLNTIIKIQKKTEETERKSRLERLNLMDELSTNISHYCTNSPVKLNLKQLPNKIWLKFLAGYLAISSKEYPHYGALDPSDTALINHIKHIHSSLLKSLSKKLGFSLTKLELMSSEQLQIAKNTGIIDIALIAHDLSVEVTNDLAFVLLKDQPEFDYWVNEIAEDSVPSHRKDVVSISLLTVIFPALKKDNYKVQKKIAFAKLCWEKLGDALKEIGCTSVTVDLKGEQDLRTFTAKHETLNMSATNFKAFRQRVKNLIPTYEKLS